MLLRTPVLPTQGILGLHVCESLLKTAIHFLNEQSSVQHGGAVDSVPGQLWASGRRGWTTLSSCAAVGSGDGILRLGRERFAGVWVINISAVRGGALS